MQLLRIIGTNIITELLKLILILHSKNTILFANKNIKINCFGQNNAHVSYWLNLNVLVFTNIKTSNF